MSLPIEEQWRPIPAYEGLYEASDRGRIKSLPRATTPGGILRPAVSKKGYLFVRLSMDGQRATRFVHHLVAYAFVGPRPAGHQIRHIDGDKANNCADNLAYGTQSENERDKLRHGRNPWATRTHCSQGHSYSEPGNLILYRGERRCRACATDNDRRRVAPVGCPDCDRKVARKNLARHLREACPTASAALGTGDGEGADRG